MVRFITKVLLSSIFIFLLAEVLPFVKISAFSSVIFFVILISILNFILKPLLILFTIPITIVTLGLFLIVINGIVVYVADSFISGIHISQGIWGAILFSILLSIANYALEKIFDED